MKSDWIDLKWKIGNLAGARHAFEEACLSIYQKKFPDKQVHGIRANPGDDGVDICVGMLGVEPIDVYQCKYFIDGINESQKDQIRNSFKQTSESKKFKLKKWFLCIPIELDMKETSWFNSWKSKQDIEIELITGSVLLSDAKELNIYNSIFEHDDSIRIKSIYDYVLNNGLMQKDKSNFSEFISIAEKDCFRLLQSLIHYHIAEFNNSVSNFHTLYQSTMAGDEFSACQYIKSVFSGNTTYKQKLSVYLILNDFSLEPVAHKYLKRYEALIEIASKENKISEIEHSMFNDVYNILKSPIFSEIRKNAYWQVYI